MKSLRSGPPGFSLVEVLVVIAVLAALAAIAVPQYLSYIERGRAAKCLANRHNIETDEKAFYIANGRTSLAVDARYLCPSGGVYAWLVFDPAGSEYPRVGCSVHYGSLPAPATVLFSSDLSTMNGLRTLAGNWAIQDGTLAPVGGKADHRLAFGDAAWKDYEIRMNAVISRSGGYGVYYRSDGKADTTGYFFQYDPVGGKFAVVKVVNGQTHSAVQQAPMPVGFSAYGQPHDISVSIQGDRHVVKVDGRAVLDFRDASFAAGMGGLGSWSNPKVNFDNLQVLQP